MNRRKFLRQSGCAAVTAAAMSASLSKLGQINAYAQDAPAAEGYKALVCVFLSGGSDCNNAVVPFNAADGYTQYSNVRAASLSLPPSCPSIPPAQVTQIILVQFWSAHVYILHSRCSTACAPLPRVGPVGARAWARYAAYLARRAFKFTHKFTLRR